VSNEYDRKDDVLIQLLIDKVDNLSDKLDTHMVEEAKKMNEITEAFQTGKHVVWFIKVTAAVATSLALGWVFFKEHFTIGLK
jgi:hypothetical protein